MARSTRSERDAQTKRAKERAVSPHLRLGNNRTAAETKQGVIPRQKTKPKGKQ
jgi:hypothetical protein